MGERKKRMGLRRALTLSLAVLLAFGLFPEALLTAALATEIRPALGHAVDFNQVYYDYLLKKADMVLELGDYQDWPLDKRAELDQVLVDGGLLQDPTSAVNLVPGAEDMPRDQAWELALTAVLERSGMPQERLSAIPRAEYFYHQQGARYWRFQFDAREPNENDSLFFFTVALDAATGIVEHFGEGAQYLDSNPEPSLPPEPGDKSEGEAIHAARMLVLNTLGQERRITPEVFDTYKVVARLSDTTMAGVRCWLVIFAGKDPELGFYFGTYDVMLDPKTLEPLETSGVGNG